MSLPNHLVPDKEMLSSLSLHLILCIETNQSESFHTINSQCLMSCFLLFFPSASTVKRAVLVPFFFHWALSVVRSFHLFLYFHCTESWWRSSLRGSVHFGSLQMGQNNSSFSSNLSRPKKKTTKKWFCCFMTNNTRAEQQIPILRLGQGNICNNDHDGLSLDEQKQ